MDNFSLPLKTLVRQTTHEQRSEALRRHCRETAVVEHGDAELVAKGFERHAELVWLPAVSWSQVELNDARGLALQDVVTHVPLRDLASGAARQVVRPDEDARWDLELRQPLGRERCAARPFQLPSPSDTSER